MVRIGQMELLVSATKLKIVQAAFSTLQSEGLPAPSYDRIAEQAQVSRQVVRYHFPDADDLMVALCDHLAALYRDRLIENAKELSGPTRIDMFLDFYFGTIDGKPKPPDDQVYDALMSRATASPNVRAALRSQYSLLGQVLAHEFQLAFPDLSQQSSNELSFAFVSMMYGHWKMVASLGFSASHNHIAREAMARMIRAFVSENSEISADTNVWRQETEQ